MTTDNLRYKAVKGAGINVIAQFVGLICHTAGVIVLARLLTPKEFGLVAMVTAFSMWLMNFGENGFAEFIIQKEYIDEKEINSIFWLHVCVACIFAIAFTFFGLWLVFFYSEPQLWGIAAVMSSSFVLTAFCTSHLALLKRQMQFSSIALVGLLAIILSVILSIAAAVAGMSYWAVVIRQLTILIVTVIGAWILCPWRPGRPQLSSMALPGLKYGLQVYGNFSIGYVMRNIDKVLLGKFHGTAILGNYDRAYYLSMMPVGQILTPLNNVALATLSRLTNDKVRFIAYYTKAAGMVSFLGTAVALILTISAQDIIMLLLGPAWKDAGLIVMAFGPGIAGMLIYGTHSWLHLSLGTPHRWMRWNVFASIITIAAFFIAASYGGVAMALAYSITTYLLIIPALWYAGKPIGISVKEVIGSLWPYFVSAATVFVSWLLLFEYFVPLHTLLVSLNLIAKVFIISCIALFFYLALVILFQGSFRSIRGVIEFIRIFIDRRKD